MLNRDDVKHFPCCINIRIEIVFILNYLFPEIFFFNNATFGTDGDGTAPQTVF